MSMPQEPIEPMPAFPPGFLWGASASAFQTEGAADVEGKGPSGWDAFAAQGRIKDGSDAARGTGFHERYREDVALLAGLGADAFRFSVSWPRVVPGGSGPVNARGLDFYDRLVDELCAHGITPAPTLYHWDTPSRSKRPAAGSVGTRPCGSPTTPPPSRSGSPTGSRCG